MRGSRINGAGGDPLFRTERRRTGMAFGRQGFRPRRAHDTGLPRIEVRHSKEWTGDELLLLFVTFGVGQIDPPHFTLVKPVNFCTCTTFHSPGDLSLANI